MIRANTEPGQYSLPLDRGRGFGADVQDDPVDAAHLVDDAVRDLLEEFVGQLGPIGGHGVFGFDDADGAGFFVGAGVAHDADRADGQEDGEVLPCLLYTSDAADE